MPIAVRDMKAHLRAGEFKKYVEHLAGTAGLFIAMAEEIADTLLTDEEKDSLEYHGGNREN